MSTIIGIAFLIATACMHHAMLMVATSVVPERLRHSRLLPIVVFSLLAVIHTLQIAAGALHRRGPGRRRPALLRMLQALQSGRGAADPAA